ncbi:hypothetical protein [Bacillus alkalicola]|uniref:Transmembrane protein n=1 Tax=Evansella alkalicola TaxID=745819 RepID=A0ABS6K006_9BACI|nr:hypothetical protein [Bacillus alkalicola]MBU9723269.1 hypothetical protein [Bacillus alkalicola]
MNSDVLTGETTDDGVDSGWWRSEVRAVLIGGAVAVASAGTHLKCSSRWKVDMNLNKMNEIERNERN